MSSFDRRSALLGPNAGLWEGQFIRLGADGQEIERFGTSLRVQDEDGEIVAALTYRPSGKVTAMRFAEPPELMAITPEGHWSLGPDKTGPWPCVMELCLVAGDRRRRVVVRHTAERLEAVVVVIEARPGVQDPPPPAPLRALAGPTLEEATTCTWQLAPGLELSTAQRRHPGEALSTRLCWRPWPGEELVVERAYAAHGLPLVAPVLA